MESTIFKNFIKGLICPPQKIKKSTTNIQNSNRIEWIDTAKGIAIILVVLGHIIFPKSLLNKFICSFHMPLFFMLSGLFVVKHLNTDFTTHFSNRFKRLMIPYLIFGLFLLAPFYWIYFHFIIPTGQIPLLQRWLAQLIGLNCDWGEEWRCSLWFLPCLFCADLMVWSIWKYVYRYRYYAVMMVFLAGVAYYLTINRSLPLRIHTSTIAILFITLGVKLKDKIFQFSITTILICVIAYIICWCGNSFSSMVMVDNNYGLIYFSIPASIFATIVVLYISKYATQISLLSLLGKQSLMIYILHQVPMPFIWVASKRLNIYGNEMIEAPIMLLVAICIAYICMKVGMFVQTKWPWMLGEIKPQTKL